MEVHKLGQVVFADKRCFSLTTDKACLHVDDGGGFTLNILKTGPIVFAFLACGQLHAQELVWVCATTDESGDSIFELKRYGDCVVPEGWTADSCYLIEEDVYKVDEDGSRETSSYSYRAVCEDRGADGVFCTSQANRWAYVFQIFDSREFLMANIWSEREDADDKLSFTVSGTCRRV